MIIPSALLSNRALALICLPDALPTIATQSVSEGDLLFRIVSPGTGSESIVSSKSSLGSRLVLATCKVPTNSAVVGRFKNPSPLDLLDRTVGGGSWIGFVGHNTVLLLELGVLRLAPLHTRLV